MNFNGRKLTTVLSQT